MKKILAVALCALMLVTVFAGCNGNGGSSVNVVVEFEIDTESFKGQELTWWTHWDILDNQGDIARFNEATGATVEYGNIGGGGVNAAYYSQIANALAAGTGPDVCSIYGWAMPSWIRKGLLEPIDKVLKLEDPFWDQFGGWREVFNEGVMDFFNYEGKIYAWADRDVNPYYMIYRKDLFEEAGLDDPAELQKKGEWNWNTFNEAMEELTYDSDDDGTIDKFGITGTLSEAFFGTVENGNFIRWREDGTPYFALTDSDMIACMEEESLVTQNWYDNSHGSWINSFCAGNIAMLVSASWDWQKACETFGTENIGWVQMPIAPSNTSGVVKNYVNAGGTAITNNIDCEGLVEHYLQYSYHSAWFTEYPEDVQSSWDEKVLASYGYSEELKAFEKQMEENVYIPNASGWGALYDLVTQKVLWNYQSGSVDQLVQSIAVAAQTIIDDVFYDVD